MLTSFLGRPHQERTEFPWRPRDNRLKRAIWAAQYYAKYNPCGHNGHNEHNEHNGHNKHEPVKFS